MTIRKLAVQLAALRPAEALRLKIRKRRRRYQAFRPEVPSSKVAKQWCSVLRLDCTEETAVSELYLLPEHLILALSCMQKVWGGGVGGKMGGRNWGI